MEKKFTYIPQGTCSQQIDITIDNDKVREVSFTGGCHGNTQGVAVLVKGMVIEEIIQKLGNIECRGKGTSCPAQLAQALRQMLEK